MASWNIVLFKTLLCCIGGIHLEQCKNAPEGASNDKDKREAQSFDVDVVEAKQRLGYERLDWLQDE